MTYIIIHTVNVKIAEQLNILENGKDIGNGQFMKPRKDLFIEAYDLNLVSDGIRKTTIGTIKVMKNCGMSWAYIASLVEKDPMGVNIFLAEDITPIYIPDLFKKAGKWLNEKKGRRITDMPKILGMTENELNEYFIDGEKKLRKKGEN